VTPQVEVEPLTVPFSGQPTASGQLVSTAGTAAVTISGLVDGKTYHWQARVTDGSGATSPWATFSVAGATTPDFGIDREPPSRPIIMSSTDPNENRWYNTRVVQLAWTSKDTLSGIQGYSYVLERRAHVIPPGSISAETSLRLPALPDGTWILALRSVDRAGNWSPTATFRVQLDRQLPKVIWLSPGGATFNPYKGPASLHFRVTKDASVRLTLYRVGTRAPLQTFTFPHLRAGQIAAVNWSGKDRRGTFVPKGYYFFSVLAVDHANNLAKWNLGGMRVDPERPHRVESGVVLYPGDGKRIIVSLSRQTLYAYDGDRLALQTFVTTGNPALPTPPGTYSVMAKYHPFQFISPWPQGSPYWYPPSWSTYAMLFRDGGYFLHDAPWRSAFGPGTNGPGQPGTNYGGTHGCVNIPPGPMLFLWNWTPIGTTVLVVP
jgi:hypothetical protein